MMPTLLVTVLCMAPLFLLMFNINLREAAKKVPPLMARPLREGGSKGRAIKEIEPSLKT